MPKKRKKLNCKDKLITTCVAHYFCFIGGTNKMCDEAKEIMNKKAQHFYDIFKDNKTE
jgi:hypothetical protein